MSSGEITFHGESYEEGASRFDGAHEDLSDAEAEHEGLQGKTANQLDGWIPGLGSGLREIEGTLGKGLSAAKGNARDIAAKLRDSRTAMNQAEADSTRPSENLLRRLRSEDTGSGTGGGGGSIASGSADGGSGRSGSAVARMLRGESSKSSSDGITSAGGSRGAARGNDKACTNGDPVDVATGDVLLAETDVSLPGLLPLVLERTHRSSWRAGRWFGAGWLSSLDQRLEVNSGRVRGAFSDGRIVTWHIPADEDAVVPETGPVWTLRRTSRESYEVHDPQRGLTWRYERRPGHYQGIFGTGVFPLVAVMDRAGHEVSFSYRPDGSPETVTHSGGYRVDVTVADGLVTALTVAGDDEPIRKFEYDEDRSLTGVINSSGLPLKYSYDGSGRLTGWEDRNGQFYRYAYNEAGQCVSGEGPGGALSGTFTYEPGITRWINVAGAATTYELTDTGLLAALTDPLGNTTRWEHDDRGNVLAAVDPLDRVTRYVYDAYHNVVAVVRPDGSRATAEYNELCLPTLLIDPDGSVWRQEFDEHGNRTAVTAPDGAVTGFQYDDQGHLAAVIGPDGVTTSITCDATGLPVEVTGPDEHIRHDIDHAGRVVRITGPDGGVSRLGWTAEGELAARVLPEGSAETFERDAEGNLVGQVTAAGATTRYEYGPLDKITAVTGPDGTRNEFGYDGELRVTEIRHGSLTWRYQYDLAGRLTAETDYNGATTSYEYDAAGQMLRQVNAAGQEISFRYDVLGNLVSQASGNAVAEFGYDLAGQLIWARNDESDLRFDRDSLGRVTAETCNGRTVTTQYDVAGRVTRRTTPSGVATTWETGPAGQPAAMTVAGQQIRFGYDPGGREISRELPGGLTLTHAWDQHGWLSAQVLSAPTQILQRRSYAYSPEGYVTGSEDLLAGNRSFGLDPAGRVNSVTGPWWTERYSYDFAGNIAGASWLDIPASLLDSESQGTRSISGTLVTQAGNIRYRHDAAGRVVSRTKTRISRAPDTWRYAWDAEDRLRSVTMPDGTIWRYMYDALGRRIAKRHLSTDGQVLAETRFTWDGAVVAEQSEQVPSRPALPQRLTTWDYQPGTFTPVAQTESTVLRETPQDEVDRRFYAIISDVTGTPSELAAPDGTIAGRQQHTLWGGTAWNSEGASSPLRFPGQYEDPETGLHYNNQRYYDPATGSYLTPDPLGLAPAANCHTYVSNPHVLIDPLGLKGKEIAGCGSSGSDKSRGSRKGYRTLYRGDTRSPDEIRAAGGFKPRGTSTDLEGYANKNISSIFVGTSKKTGPAQGFVARKGGWVYEIKAPRDQGIDVNRELGVFYQNRTEKEIAFPGGIPLEWITRVRPSRYTWRGPWQKF